MISALINAAVLIVAASLFIAAAVSDVRSFRIPNSVCALLLAAFPAYVATAPNPIEWKGNILVFGLTLAIGFACFLGNIVGAGDVKLLSVASLWAGPPFVGALLIITAFVGGAESLAVTVTRYIKSKKTKKIMQLSKTEIPYGVAIAAGGLTVLSMIAQPLFVRLG